MPFLKNEKYPNNDTNQYEENDSAYDVYYNSGSPDFNVSYHSDIDAAGQFKYENNNNNFYPNNTFLSFTPFTSFYTNQTGLFGNATNINNTMGGLFGNGNHINSTSIFGVNKVIGINNNNNNKGNLFSLFNN